MTAAPRVVLVNQEFVHKYFHDRDPLGKQIELDMSRGFRGVERNCGRGERCEELLRRSAH